MLYRLFSRPSRFTATLLLCGTTSAAYAQTASFGVSTPAEQEARTKLHRIATDQANVTAIRTAGTPSATKGGQTAAQPEQVVVTAHLDAERVGLQPNTGATVFSFSRQGIDTVPQGDNAPLNQILLQAPGVAQDSYGQIHVRGDHNEVQFRLDGVQLPEGLTVFGQALMTRFANNMSLTTGALPSEYGFDQAAVIDITTKNGTTNPGGDLSIYGGARDYFFPSLQYGFSHGKWDFFATGDFVHDRVGIENPTSSFNAIHDLSNQYHFLGHVRYTANDTTRVSLIAGVSNAEYQLPNNPGQQRQFADSSYLGSSLSQQLYGSVDSASLDERQKEITDFGILSLEKELGVINLQTSAFVRYSSLGYSPDPVGDLVYNGIAQRAERGVFSSGNQTDFTWHVSHDHTIRFGGQAFIERNISKTDSTVFSEIGDDGDGNPVYSTTPTTIHQGSGLTGWIWGLYAQDEWHVTHNFIINYGLRYDGVSEYTHAQQLSPRINVVYMPWRGGTLHAGYSRYLTPPPFEQVGGTSLAAFANTSAAPGTLQDSPVKAERDHYFDGGIAQEILPGWHASFDAYLKLAHNLIDEGQFGSPVILSAFNYRRGQVHGYEFSTTYDHGPWSLYGNAAWSRAIGKDITSAQWNFDPDDLAYIQHRWIHLDHDQRWTASAGAAYSFFHKTGHSLRVSGTMVYGSGLRADGAVPNGISVPQYETFNLSAVQSFKDLFHLSFLKRTQLRLDVINLFDKRYELRTGSGIGVGAPQWGLRRTIYTGISQRF
jgi:outer membrane receptor protein involved in Fe transport